MLLKPLAAAVGLLGVLSAPALPTESEQYRQRVLADKALKPAELLDQYAARSFAPIWLRSEPATVLGFIGPDYQRLRVKLLTVRPVAGQPGHYTVTGKSKVGATVAPFEGEFTVLHVREKLGPPRTLDNEPTIAVKSGIVLARYELREPPGQPRTGVFRGLLHARWYQDRTGKLYYDDLENFADSYANNQFVGTWQSYRSGAVKRCNWGNHRIPNSQELDQGAGEFSPVDKYLANGWLSYRRAWGAGDRAAQQLEEAP
jgi:hypothetical protein